jgi:hypothetical protein
MDSILHWNQIAIDANKTDFSSPTANDRVMPQQGGPTRTSRALAIVHLAMYDAYVGVKSGTGPGKTYLTYGAGEIPGTTDLQAAQAAVATAACLTLTALYSRQKDTFLREHADFIAKLPDHDPKIARGIAWGQLVAGKMLDLRKNDGADASDDFYAPSTEPGRHRADPMAPGQGFLGPLWGKVKPFGVANLTSVIPAVDPPTLNSSSYATDFNEVFAKGRDNGGTRTPEETTIGIFWAYDGARNVGVPPRLYNQAVRAISMKHGASEATNAKLFAAVNVAMADAGIIAWHEKYLYNLWRPVVGVREASIGWGPSRLGDGNSLTTGDPYWVPLGAPRTNQPGVGGVTPNFPAYPSGHATFGTVALRVAEKLLNLPATFKFEFVSDELNGQNVDAFTGARPYHSREMTIAMGIEENIISRIYLGVHWKFDGREGERLGNEIANKIAPAFPAMA